jgi:hypothetical protein
MIEELYAWIVDDPTGEHGIIGVLTPSGLPMQAVSSKRHLMERGEFADVAGRTAKQLGLPVQLVKFTRAEVLTEKKR